MWAFKVWLGGARGIIGLVSSFRLQWCAQHVFGFFYQFLCQGLLISRLLFHQQTYHDNAGHFNVLQEGPSWSPYSKPWGDRNEALRGAGEAWPQPKVPQSIPKVPHPKVPHQLLTKAKQRCGGKPRASFLIKMEVCAPSHYVMG